MEKEKEEEEEEEEEEKKKVSLTSRCSHLKQGSLCPTPQAVEWY